MKILRISRLQCKRLRPKVPKVTDEEVFRMLSRKHPTIYPEKPVTLRHKQPRGILNIGCGVSIGYCTLDEGVLHIDYLKEKERNRVSSLTLPLRPGIWHCFYKILGIRLGDMNVRLSSNVPVVIIGYTTKKVRIPI
ncbi:hypothetical protein DRP04_00735 [Archaeoglobales archaeon]|nr:MAG: hypothetical protein DRP04_00735 [Archaeoglobales archaeon]